MTKTVAIIAATIVGNRGAEAMAEASIGLIRARLPDARFHLFSYYPADDARLIDDPAVTVYSSTPATLVAALLPGALLGGLFRLLRLPLPKSLMPRVARGIAEADLLIDLAGVSFVDGREKFLPFNILTIWPAMLLGVPVLKFSQALGSFKNPVNRLAARIFLPGCDRVFARGDKTLAHLQTLNFRPGLVQRANDIAFLFDPKYALSRSTAAYADSLCQRISDLGAEVDSVIGICPSSVVAKTATWDYEGYLAKLVGEELAKGRGVVLFPNATRAEHGLKLRNNDLPVIQKIVERLESDARDKVVAVDQDLDAAGIKRVIEALDVAVVSRFHAMVGALSLAVPVVVIGWSHKYLEIMALFGQEDCVFDHSGAEFRDLVAKLEDAFERREAIRAAIEARLPEVSEGSMIQIERALEILDARA